MKLKQEWVDNINKQGHGFKKKCYEASWIAKTTFISKFYGMNVTDDISDKLTDWLNKAFTEKTGKKFNFKKEDYFE